MESKIDEIEVMERKVGEVEVLMAEPNESVDIIDYASAVAHLSDQNSSDVLFASTISKLKTLTQEKDERGSTLLHVAAEFGRLEACISLINNGARPGLRNTQGENAAHVACRFSQTHCAVLLLEAIDEARLIEPWIF